MVAEWNAVASWVLRQSERLEELRLTLLVLQIMIQTTAFIEEFS